MNPQLPANRRERLLAILERDGEIQLEAAAAELGVSTMTVRRDIQVLHDESRLRRVRGGAMAVVLPRMFDDRAAMRSSAKVAIARKAADLVPISGAAAFDASTTSGALLSVVRADELLVVTNSIDNAALARARPGVRAVLAGGELEVHTGSLVGPVAERTARGFSFDRFFTSASAVDVFAGTMEVSLEEAAVKSAFADRSSSVVVLADSSKLNQHALTVGVDWAAIDILVTELHPGDERLASFRKLVEVR
ncbi:MAG: DeoR/GlpR family DNA-binding transcription regulator [Microcella sp.]